ncbi:hypothetical protein DWY22_13555 [Heyndrickxia coagulans]|jgi:hypothetical protein|nr:hypothetical protein DWY22_13555 [Heyndrickxia coagulans]RGR94589.1 hypothetical protein DWY16_13850 [Heyndrickxia coagulans]
MYPFPLYHGTKRKFRKTTIFFTGAYPKNGRKPSCSGRLNRFPEKKHKGKTLKAARILKQPKKPGTHGAAPDFFIVNTHP